MTSLWVLVQAEARRKAGVAKAIQISVPDVHSPGFASEARRQSLLANASLEAADIQAFMDSVSEWPDDHESP